MEPRGNRFCRQDSRLERKVNTGRINRIDKATRVADQHPPWPCLLSRTIGELFGHIKLSDLSRVLQPPRDAGTVGDLFAERFFWRTLPLENKVVVADQTNADGAITERDVPEPSFFGFRVQDACHLGLAAARSFCTIEVTPDRSLLQVVVILLDPQPVCDHCRLTRSINNHLGHNLLLFAVGGFDRNLVRRLFAKIDIQHSRLINGRCTAIECGFP